MLATLTIRGPILVDTAAMLAAYQSIEKRLRGSQIRLLKQSEQLGWPISRTTLLDEFNEVRRSVFREVTSLCLTATQHSSAGSSAS